MTQGTVWPDFRNEHGEGKYPFSDDSTLVADDGMVLSEALLLDAILYPPGTTSGLRITRIDVVAGLVTWYIGDDAEPERAVAEIRPLSPTAEILVTDLYGRPAGLLVSTVDQVAAMQSLTLGSHPFPASGAVFAASCVIPTPELALRGLALETGELVSDDVWLVGDGGVVLSEVNGNIRVDIVGDPLFRRQLCQNLSQYRTPSYLRYFGSVGPDANGNVSLIPGNHLAPDPILRIYVDGDGLHIGVVGQKADT